jgi:hypothetical protein
MKKAVIIILIATGVVVAFYKGAELFSPGSYPNAEEYELDYSEEEVKNAITKFKQEYPEYIVPKVTINNQGSLDLTDGQSKEPSHWYDVYFYYKNENQIIFTWTRPIDKNKTTFAFVSINEGLDLGNWKDINKDFSFFENKEEKKKFEERILSKIKEELNIGK